jgi:hypothetical protein
MAVPDKLILFDDNTQILQLFGLAQLQPGTPSDQDQITIPVVDAVVTATLQDGEGVNVPGCIGVVLSPIGSPPSGDYAGRVGTDFNPAVGTDYMLLVDADSGIDHLHLEIIVEVQSRRRS